MLVHSNSKGSALVRGVCHPSVLHTVQNDKGLVDGLAGGMWTQHCGGIRGLWWRTFRRRYEFIFQYFLSVFFIRLCMAFLSQEYLYFILYILWGGCVDIYMAEERASQLSSSSVFHSLVLDLESLQRIFVTFNCIFSGVVAEVCMAEERAGAGQYWHSSLDRRVGDTWINGGSEACITIHN